MSVIDEKIVESFRNEGFQNLTKIQKISAPVISRKQNCLLVAPTGSGKTEASIIPIFSLLENERENNVDFVNDNAILVLYITPLRALNNDVLRRIISYAKKESRCSYKAWRYNKNCKTQVNPKTTSYTYNHPRIFRNNPNAG